MMNAIVPHICLSKIVLLILIIIPANVLTNSLNDVWMRNIARELSDDVKVLKNEELGVNYIKKLYSTFQYTSTVIDANKTVNEIAHHLEAKIEDIFSALMKTKYSVDAMQCLNNTTETLSTLFPCVTSKDQELPVNNTSEDDDLLRFGAHTDFNLNYVLQGLKSRMNVVQNGVKQQYFITSGDLISGTYPQLVACKGIDHMLLWGNYMSRNTYASRNIVLLLDHGASLSRRHFQLVKEIGKQVIDSLTEFDKISLLAISNEWTSPKLTDECLMPNQVPSVVSDVPDLTPVNSLTKKILYKFIEGISKGDSATNHLLGFEKALKVVKKSQLQNETVMIIYVSRGLLSSLTEIRNVLEVIQQATVRIITPFVINTCTVIDENRSVIYETQFMEDVALQNYEKYNISSSGNTIPGRMIAVNCSEAIGFALSSFYDYYNHQLLYDVERKISFPMWDQKSDDLTVSFSLSYMNGQQLNVLGTDVLFGSLAEDFVYFNNQRDYYTFLIDLQGHVIIHPKFPSLTTVKQQLFYVDIGHFENIPMLDIAKKRLLSEPEGVQLIPQFGSFIKWSWKRIGDWYIVCLVTQDPPLIGNRAHQIKWPYNTSEPYNIRLVYQQMDSNDNCRHLNHVATLDAGSLYLSPSCFKSPALFNELKNEESLKVFTAFFRNDSHLLSNPGVKTEIKDEVAALAYILAFLRAQQLTSYKSKYIVRRYVSSYNGVLEMFPGSILNTDLDPTKRPWFTKAVEHKSRLIMIPPYLDEGGAGYIVTLAYASSNVVVAVDVTYGYIFRILLKRMPFCLSTNITCLLMDDRGYLIYHPNLIDPNGHGPVEKQHIVHKESLVANDILNQKLFIQKVLCNSYGGGTVQRYYKLNISYSDVLVNSVQGENCVSYYITAIRNTNIFVGVVNATCNVMATFCPCSIVDRLCLNCNRMEQQECECPCECPLEKSKCTEYNNDDNSICSWFPEHASSKVGFYDDVAKDMKSCFPATCTAEKTHMRCLGVTGCEWCKMDVDGSQLDHPFCGSMATCFNGVIGSVPPYRNLLNEHEIPNGSISMPISVIALFVFGVLVLLCLFYMHHRSNAPQPTERLYLSSTQDNRLRMSDLNLSDTYAMGNHRDKLLQDDKPDPISPYCVSSNYKRTTLAADSDHGYSTMTQHDESERMSLAPIEMDSLEDDLASDSFSINTSVSGKPVGHESTQIPYSAKKKCIMVPVTVHRHMETT